MQLFAGAPPGAAKQSWALTRCGAAQPFPAHSPSFRVSFSRKFIMNCHGVNLSFPNKSLFLPQHNLLISVEEKGLSGAVYHHLGRLLEEKLK